MFLKGTPATLRNFELALGLLTLSSEDGDQDAQYNLGYMYSSGIGVEKNYQIANRWYRESAEQGHASAQMALAISYLSGAGITRDPNTGSQWLKRSGDKKPNLFQSESDMLAELRSLIAICDTNIASR